MVESTTLNYHWTKPELTKSPSTWGKFLNDDLDAIDGLVFANQQAIVPIGAINMYGGATAPANWLICDGRTLDYGVTPAYQALFNIIGRAFNPALTGTQFALPNMVQKFPLGVGVTGLGASGGNFSVGLAIANMPAHAHTASQAAHTHPGSYQDAHVHVIATGNHSHGIATGGHSHAIHTGGHAHGPGSLMKFVGSGGTLGVSASPFNVAQGTTDSVGDLGGNTDAAGNLGGNTDTAGNLGGSADSRQPAIHIDTQQPAVTVASNGSGTPFNVVPPYLALNFIIRYQ